MVFLTLTCLNLNDLGGFVHNIMMKKTPFLVILVIFMAVCAWAVRHGLETVVHYNFLFSNGLAGRCGDLHPFYHSSYAA